MTKLKLYLLLTVLLISSSISLTGSALAASGSNPFEFPTPTPTPTETPTPTATPAPTPRPEPKIWPTLTMYCTSNADAANPKVTVTGALTYNYTGIKDASIYVGYSADGGVNWQNFSLAKTEADGSFEAIWKANATGNYLMCASWEGNLTLHWLNATAYLALTPDSAGHLFSVYSNHSISSIAYDSAAQKLSFSTNGTSAAGFAYVCVSKALVSDAQALQLVIDGKSVAFGSESGDDAWIVSCVYTQGAHTFGLQVPFAEVLSPEQSPWVLIVVVIVVLAVIAILALTIRRRRRTAATVASILKQDRPVY